MSQYRKKPVVIDAWQNNLGSDVPDWVLDAVVITDDGSLIIRTLEGDMRASLNDWIIQGISKEVYPCKPDIFAATYELALSDEPIKYDELFDDLTEEYASSIMNWFRRKITAVGYDVSFENMADLKAGIKYDLFGFGTVVQRYHAVGIPTGGLRDALESIAANTCCDRCQEAALVARKALSESGIES